jgi:hypothetical protein
MLAKVAAAPKTAAAVPVAVVITIAAGRPGQEVAGGRARAAVRKESGGARLVMLTYTNLV